MGRQSPASQVSLIFGTLGPRRERSSWVRKGLHREVAEPWNLEGDLDREGRNTRRASRDEGHWPAGLGNLTLFTIVTIFGACLHSLRALLLGKKGVSLKKHMPCSQAQRATERFV